MRRSDRVARCRFRCLAWSLAESRNKLFLFLEVNMSKTIGLLTGGGDVPGLNPCMKAVVLSALEVGYRVIGIRKGWGGLLNYNLDEPSTHDLSLIHISEPTRLGMISYAVFCLKKKKKIIST